MATAPTPLTDTPPFPVLADRAAGTYNSKAFAFGTHMGDVFNAELEAMAENVYDNALDAAASATTANDAAADAETAASAAEASAASAVAAPGTSATSTTSLVVGTGSKSLTVQTGKAFSVGQSVVIADTAAPATNWMFGQVTSYNSGTGALVVNATVSAGSGTIAAWTISISANPAAASAAAIGIGGRTITGNLTLTITGSVIADAAISVTPTAPGLYVTLPVATTITTEGVTQISVYNAGDFDYGVKDSAGTVLGWVRPRAGAIIGLADNSTAAGVWAPYGLEKTGITAQYVNSTATNTGSNLRRIALDVDRTCFLFGGTTCYAIVYNASTQTWGTATSVRTGLANGAFIGVLSATNQVLVCSNDSTTGMQTVTLTISGTGVTVNSPVSTTLAGNWATYSNLIAAGSSFVIGYTRAATVAGLRAISVSGTVPTVGAESTPTGNQAIYLFASGSVVRTLSYNGSVIYATPYTVSGSTLTLGTAASRTLTATTTPRVFVNGNGNIICEFTNTTHFAVIFKLTGTTEAVSSVSLGTLPTNYTGFADYVQVTASKTLFIYSDGSLWYANILTDTSGTASAGSEISGALSSITSVAGITSSGNSARVNVTGSSTAQVVLDCSGTSPVLSSVSAMSVAAGAASFYRTSDIYGVRSGQSLLAGQSAYGLALSASSFFDTRFTLSGVSRCGATVPQFSAAAISGSASNESFIYSPISSTTGFAIQRVEAAA